MVLCSIKYFCSADAGMLIGVQNMGKMDCDLKSLDNNQIVSRKNKLNNLRSYGNPYPNNFRRDTLTHDIYINYNKKSSDYLNDHNITVHIAGRIMTKRVMGKASFCHIQDMSGQIQVYVKQDNISHDEYENFVNLDLGDIIGIIGILFKTHSGELSVKAQNLFLLTKALLPMPEKFHGLINNETRYRQRYLDLISNVETRRIFKIRSQIINEIRNFFIKKGFLEVETPMMHMVSGGAIARPFITYHNALESQLYLRIAPELFLKKLVIGGFEKVFEINRNFRNEGISTRHNPEFTMLEFYCAYTDYHDLMNITEEILQYLSFKILHSTKIKYQGIEIDFSIPFKKITMKDAIINFNTDICENDLNNIELARNLAHNLGIKINSNYGLGKIQYEIFEKTVEKKLLLPTFITSYPIEVSPLARANDSDSSISDRFEFFIGGKEIANGFSELNDPDEQDRRFQKQVENLTRGDNEAMHYDDDYVTALKYGLPPTAGEGIGIDRLVMILTDMPSIRDVILFPLLRQDC